MINDKDCSRKQQPKLDNKIINKSCCGDVSHGVKDEILCHLPYAILSVALSMIFLNLFSFSQSGNINTVLTGKLFHNFHFLHILFAGTGTVLMFRKYSKNITLCFFVGLLVPLFFCTLSDAFLPYIGGKILGLDMHFHWCILSHLGNIIPFLATGIINGFVMSLHSSSQIVFYSAGSHFFHIFISAMASMLYLATFGFQEWGSKIGFIFMYIIGVVMVPCICADIIIPILFARFLQKGKNKQI
jgi:hypothetical protein